MSSPEARLHMIGHGHIDPVWLWRRPEGIEEVRATFQSALDRMRETDEFTFTSSSAAFYKWVRDLEPEMFDEIRDRVRQGRWEPTGGWWVEPDCNIPHGESFARHGLYAQRFFLREFGVRPRVGFNPDSFGHARTLPQILLKSGLEFYCYMRPEPEREMEYPRGCAVFRWRSPDGSQALAGLIPHSYGSGDHVKRKIQAATGWGRLLEGQRELLCFYGVGNHGGGPTRAAIDAILQARNEQPRRRIVFSTLQGFFSAMIENPPEEPPPLIDAELQHHARGCYSVHSEIKALNRRCEHALMTAEKFAAAAQALLRVPAPMDLIRSCWESTLFNQFHDILAGTSIEPAYADARDELGAVRFRAEELLHCCLTRMARRIDTSAPGRSLVVFNPLPWPVTAPITVSPHLERHLGVAALLDEDSNPVPTQRVLGGRVGSHNIHALVELPPLGYRVFRATAGGEARAPAPWGALEVSETRLQNDFWLIEIDPFTGEISRLLDKTADVEVLDRGATLEVMVDHSDTWSHDVAEYRVEDGRFANPVISVFDRGPVAASLRIRTSFSRSEADQFITLYRGSPIIHGRLELDWRESYRTLKLGFETRITNGKVVAEAAYGSVEREPDGREEPCQSWIDLGGTAENRNGVGLDYGFALINDCKYGCDALGGTLRLTLLRSPAYAHHDPDRFRADLPHPIIDQGRQTVLWRMAPHAGDWRAAGVPRQAYELNNPPIAHQEYAHSGDWPATRSFLAAEPANIVVTVFKPAEDGGGYMVRGYEAHGRRTLASIALGALDRTVEIEFGPHEIKTLFIPDRGEPMEVNLIEDGASG